jgi:hypothetical protein
MDEPWWLSGLMWVEIEEELHVPLLRLIGRCARDGIPGLYVPPTGVQVGVLLTGLSGDMGLQQLRGDPYGVT